MQKQQFDGLCLLQINKATRTLRGVGRRTVGRGPGSGSGTSGAPTTTAGSLRRRRRSAGAATKRCRTSRVTAAAHWSAFRTVSSILVTTSGELILLPVWERHPELNLGQCPLTKYSDSDIPPLFCALSRHSVLSETKITTKTTSGSGFDLNFRLRTPGFLLESWFVAVYHHVLLSLLLERSHYKATRSTTVTLGRKNAPPQSTANWLILSQNVELTHNCGYHFRVRT